MGVIYVRPNLINGKKYVGQATDLEVRQKAWNCLTQPYAGPAINNARAKYGIDNFGFEILKECKDEELDYWEKYYIKELNTKAPYGYNLTDGGDGCKGYHHTEETRKKISETHKGEKCYIYGKHHTEETRKKLSEAKKGEKNFNYGKHHSEETKKKMSENKKNKKIVIQIDKNTNEIIAEFPSIREAERQTGFKNDCISNCCKGRTKSSYGYIWRHKESVA